MKLSIRKVSTSFIVMTMFIVVSLFASKFVYANPCPLDSNKAYKDGNSSAVYYITDQCTKRVFPNSNIYFTHFNSWNDIHLVSQNILNSIKDDIFVSMALGSLYVPPSGALVKSVYNSKVYMFADKMWHWIESENVFQILGYKWDWIEDVDSYVIDKYNFGEKIDYTTYHPNGTLIKYSDSAKIYQLQADIFSTTKQVKRHIKDEAQFHRLGLKFDHIITIDSSEQYEDSLIRQHGDAYTDFVSVGMSNNLIHFTARSFLRDPKESAGYLVEERGDESFQVIDEKIIGRIQDYDSISRVYSLHNTKEHKGEAVWYARNDSSLFVYHDGRRMGPYPFKYVTDAIFLDDSIAFIALGAQSQDNQDNWYVVCGNKTFGPYQNPQYGFMPEVIDGNLAFRAQRDGDMFIVYDGKEIGHEYVFVNKSIQVDNKIAFKGTRNMDDGSSETVLIYGEEEISKKMGFNNVIEYANIGGSLAFTALKNDKTFVVYKGEIVDSFSHVLSSGEEDLKDIGGTLTYIGLEGNESEYKLYVRYGQERFGPFDKIYSSPLEQNLDEIISSINDKMFFIANSNGQAMIFYDGQEFLLPEGYSFYDYRESCPTDEININIAHYRINDCAENYIAAHSFNVDIIEDKPVYSIAVNGEQMLFHGHESISLRSNISLIYSKFVLINGKIAIVGVEKLKELNKIKMFLLIDGKQAGKEYDEIIDFVVFNNQITFLAMRDDTLYMVNNNIEEKVENDTKIGRLLTLNNKIVYSLIENGNGWIQYGTERIGPFEDVSLLETVDVIALTDRIYFKGKLEGEWRILSIP